MISNPGTEESATALYLNLSSLDEAKPLIASSLAVHFLVQLLHSDDTSTSKHDALYALNNLSSHPSNIQPLLNSGIVAGLHSLLIVSESQSHLLIEKALAVLINLASSNAGREEIVSTPGLVSSLAAILDTAELPEQEQAVSCLLILCTADEKCSQAVLQEGVIPALVSVSANGTARGRDKAQRLLKLFREQRLRESPQVQQEQNQDEDNAGNNVVSVVEMKPLCKTRSKFGRTLSSMWKKKISVYQC